MIKALVLFAALTVASMFVLQMFWNNTTVAFTALDIQFTWRLIVAMAVGGYIASKIA